MNMLELIRTMCAQLGLTQPSSVIGNGDRTISQMHALLIQLGSDIVTQHAWRRLIREHIIVTRAYETQATTTKGSAQVNVQDASALNDNWIIRGEGLAPFSRVVSKSGSSVTIDQPALASGTTLITCHQTGYPLPADWHRQVPMTEWDRSKRWPVGGSRTPQVWAQYKSGIVYPGPWDMFRLIGNAFVVMPPPPSGLTFSFEYISKNWVVGSGNTAKPQPTEDTDQFIFSDALLMTGLKARWFDQHGIDSTIEKADFAGLLASAKGQDQSAAPLSISPAPASVLLDSRSIPDGSWGHGY